METTGRFEAERSEVERFETERPRLERIAHGILRDRHEAQDVVQQAWVRLATSSESATIGSLPAWLTTVVTRLCLDRLRKGAPELVEELSETGDPRWAGPSWTDVGDRVSQADGDPAYRVALADSVGVALQVVIEGLTPNERVAFVLHETFGVDHETIAQILRTTSAASRKLNSRARAKISSLSPQSTPAQWEVVDAFLSAARGGDFARLIHLLAPDATISADPAAIAAGTPAHLVGRNAVASMFEGAARAALPIYLGEEAAAAWYHQGTPRVVFDFRVVDGQVHEIVFRARPEVLASVRRRYDERTTPPRAHEPVTLDPSSTATTQIPLSQAHQQAELPRRHHEDDDLPTARRPLRPPSPRRHRRRGD